MTQFERNIINISGNRGKAWLEDLPNVIKKMSENWELSDLKPVSNLSYNYVLSGLQGNRPIILKLSVVMDGLQREATALKAFSDFGAVKVLAQQEGALLLERAVPGIALESYFPQRDREAIQIAFEVMHRLHQTPLNEQVIFPHIRDWLLELNKDWPIPAHYLEKARNLKDKLLDTRAQLVLLHGDLHHDNILQNGNDWVVIDPKGVIGYPANEIWAFICNPLGKSSVNTIIEDRINEFANKLNLDSQVIVDWCFVQSVLSWVWSLEDNLEPSFVCLTEILNNLATP